MNNNIKKTNRNKSIKIALVQSPLNYNSAAIPGVGYFPPLGLLSLATYIEKRIPNIEIKVLDADYLGLEQTKDAIEDIEPDIIGIGVQACEAYRDGLELAKCAKDYGSLVIMGGEYSSLVARQIISNRNFIDYVVNGQGEVPLELIIKKENNDNIPNLVYRSNGEIKENPKQRIALGLLPIPRREYIDLSKYSNKFRETLEASLTGKTSFVTVKTQDFCLKAIKEDVCSFCKREDLFGSGIRKPDAFWKEMLYLQGIGVDYVWDVSPSFSSVGLKYLDKLAKAKPKSSKVVYRVYARAADIVDENLVGLLKEIGVENVLVGFDSGNQSCLDSSNKRTTIEQNFKAAKNLRKYGIASYSGFILGHIAETYRSMEDTLNHAIELKEIIGEKLFRITTCSKMQLYPGTWEYNRFLDYKPSLREKMKNTDDLDIHAISEAYFREFLNIDPFAADEICEKIRCLSPIKSGKDLKKFDISNQLVEQLEVMP